MEINNYLVTLGIRPAEMTGLKQLPGSTKDRVTPLVLLAPWLATSPLSKAIDKFEDAYSDRPYFIDIDSYYELNEKINEAKLLWQRLAHRPADLDAWWELLSVYKNANPCLLLGGMSLADTWKQVQWARTNNRSFCLKLNLDSQLSSQLPVWLPDFVSRLAAEGAADYFVVLEFGWVDNAINIALRAVNYTKSLFSTLPPEVPIAISCTSFPKDFTIFDGTTSLEFTNRRLVDQIRKQTNHPRIIYADWGSTRPRKKGTASQPKHRIDYPIDSAWIFTRSQKASISFKDAAVSIIKDKNWNGKLGIWGEQLIEGTATGHAISIDSMQKMYAARINIHLHRQAFFGNLPLPEALDEPWKDD